MNRRWWPVLAAVVAATAAVGGEYVGVYGESDCARFLREADDPGNWGGYMGYWEGFYAARNLDAGASTGEVSGFAGRISFAREWCAAHPGERMVDVTRMMFALERAGVVIGLGASAIDAGEDGRFVNVDRADWK